MIQASMTFTSTGSGLIKLKRLAATLTTIVIGMMMPGKVSALAGKAGPKVGMQPPPLVLSQVLQGPHLTEITWEKMRGKVVVLEFWNTQCAPCVAAIPHMNTLVEQFTSRSVVFLSISDDNPDHAKGFLKRKPMRGWVALDGPLTATRSAYDVRGIPHLLLVDQNGVIAGITHPQKLKAEHIEEVLAGKPSSLPPQKVMEEDEQSEQTIPVAVPQQKILELSIHGPLPPPDGAFNMIQWVTPGSEFKAEKAYLADTIAEFFGVQRTDVLSKDLLPKDIYDFRISVPTDKAGQMTAHFVSAFETAFALRPEVKQVMREVYAMRIASTNVSGLQLTSGKGGGGQHPGGFAFKAGSMKTIAAFFTLSLRKTVIDETLSTNRWRTEINWKLSEAEQLPGRLFDKLEEPTVKRFESDASSPELMQALESVRGQVTSADFALLSQELAKPAPERFQPDPAAIIVAAREQLGLELVLTNKMMKVVEVVPSP